jgi:hypothetical protein
MKILIFDYNQTQLLCCKTFVERKNAHNYNVVDILFTAMTPTACLLAASSKNHSSAKRKLLLLVV